MSDDPRKPPSKPDPIIPQRPPPPPPERHEEEEQPAPPAHAPSRMDRGRPKPRRITPPTGNPVIIKDQKQGDAHHRRRPIGGGGPMGISSLVIIC